MASPSVLRVSGPIILDWGNGIRLQISPVAPSSAEATSRREPPARRGRKPSPATAALIKAMHEDAATNRPRTKDQYIALLKQAGHRGSAAGAAMIVNREAKRRFGKTLGRAKQRSSRQNSRVMGPVRPSLLVRAKLKEDAAKGQLHNAAHYTRWIVDEANIGLKRARPMVYRELRAFT